MNDPYRKVQTGDPAVISARAWNDVIDVARGLGAGRAGVTQQPDHRAVMTDRLAPNTILVRNDSGSDQLQYAVLGIASILISPTDNLSEFKNNFALSGVTPLAASHKGKFCVLLEPLAAGKIGRAAVDGVCAVQTNVSSAADSAGTATADVKDSDATQLDLQTGGSAYVLWRESGTGLKWAIMRLGILLSAGGGGGLTQQHNIVQRVYGSTATWTKPANLDFIIVELIGGGGGGGGTSTTGAGQNSVSGGGASGGYSRKQFGAAALSATETVTVGALGAGGAVGAAGGNGTTSMFKTANAPGGPGGATTLVTGVNGGVAAGGFANLPGVGDIANVGASGSAGFVITTDIISGGKGGAGLYAGNGGDGISGLQNTAGAAGNGGVGGLIVITEFYTS